jgi:prepilin-type N-terminal cleavage/methylation domain-containing protein
MIKHALYAKYSKRGFTIVELIVVIAVIGILASISIVSYTQVQQRSRDSQRQSDMTVLQNELEKFYDTNGVYPPGCPLASCSTTLLTDNTASAIINPTTTVTSMKGILPGIPSTFGDPRAASTTPIMDTTTTLKEYFYYGGTVNYRASASSASYGGSASFPCTIQSALNPGDVGSYVIGYYSESTAQWVLASGKHGVPSTVTAGGCVINS